MDNTQDHIDINELIASTRAFLKEITEMHLLNEEHPERLVRRNREVSYVIGIRGMAKVINEEGVEVDGEAIKDLDGESCEEDFADWFDEGSGLDFINCGFLEFEYVDGKLYSITTYESSREPTESELQTLIDYTVGQWSDGIGEGFEQGTIKGLAISAWREGQEIDVSVKEMLKNTKTLARYRINPYLCNSYLK